MPWFVVIWTPEIVMKLALHGVSQDEFEEVVFAAKRRAVEVSRSNPHHLTIIGATSAGRVLRCVWKDINGTDIMPVTAYDHDPGVEQ